MIDAGPFFMAVMLPIIIWEAAWKGIGMWRAARNNHLWWFIAIFVLNTLGILPIIYIYFFQKKAKKRH